MDIFPHFSFNENKLIDGEVYTRFKYCRSANINKCKKYYKEIEKPGIYTCPYGYNSYVTKNSLKNRKIYTSIIIKDTNNNIQKIRKRGEIKNTFKYDEISRLCGLFELNQKEKDLEIKAENNEETIVHGIFHEIRSLSRELDTHAKYVQQFSNRNDDLISRILDTIQRTIKLISIRIDSYELLKNPETILSGVQPKIAIYKKFDKCRYILQSRALDKDCHINFINECHSTIDGYEIFDLLPFIILDNCVKYSPNNESIDIVFNESRRNIIVKNIGPVLENGEKESIFDIGIRGINARKFQGSGIGLNMMKQIAELHNISFDVESSNKVLYIRNEIPFSEFILSLKY